MNIRPDLIPGLQSLLLKIDEATAALEQHNALISPAEATAARLTSRLADLDAQAAELADHHIPADQDRIARLIAGDDVQQLDSKGIEARAAKARGVAAQRRQVIEDAAAVQQHLGELNAKAVILRQDIGNAEGAFLRALADAILDAYKLSALEFVQASVPALYSIAARLKSKTGDGPNWAELVFPGPAINWGEDEMVPNPMRAHVNLMHKRTVVWPRPDGKLLSGEPVYSDELVDALILAIRLHDNSGNQQEAAAA